MTFRKIALFLGVRVKPSMVLRGTYMNLKYRYHICTVITVSNKEKQFTSVSGVLTKVYLLIEQLHEGYLSF